MNYRVIAFGEDENGFWNEPSFHSNLEDARNYYSRVINANLPDCLGVVLVEVNHEDFRVINRVGSDSYEVTYSFGVCRVKNKKQELVISDI